MAARQMALGLAAGALLLAAPAAVSAHHSFAMFDQSKSLALSGTIKEFQWTNPHAWVQLLATDPVTGQAVEWSIEAGSPNAMAHQGWKRTSIKAGDKASVVIHPLKDGSIGGSLVSAVINGTPVGAPSSAGP